MKDFIYRVVWDNNPSDSKEDRDINFHFAVLMVTVFVSINISLVMYGIGLLLPVGQAFHTVSSYAIPTLLGINFLVACNFGVQAFARLKEQEERDAEEN